MNSGVNSSICVRLNPASSDRGLPFVYRVAGLPLLTDREVKELEHLRARRDRRDRQWAKEPGRIQADHLVYEGPGLVGGIRYQVECRSGPSGYILSLSNGSRFAIRSDGARITRLAGPAEVEILLGPVLILALALQGRWCFHASAVRARSEVLAFMGESGSGKSTIANYLSAHHRDRFQWLADDCLVLESREDKIIAHADYPQLKRSSQQPVEVKQSVLKTAYLVDSSSEGSPVAKPVKRLKSWTDLTRHTLAARLFDRRLTQAHIEFCSKVPEAVNIYCLALPHRHENLGWLAGSL